MPQVPRYFSQVTQNAPTTRMQYTPVENGGMAQAQQNLAGELGGLAGAIKQQQDKDDELSVTNALTEYEKQKISFLYGENGQFSRNGINALDGKDDQGNEVPGVLKATDSGLQKIAIETGKGLNDRQKQLFARRIADSNIPTMNATAKYQNKQQGVAWKESYDSANTTLTNGFSTNMMMASQQQDADLKNQFQLAANQNIRDMVANEIMYGKRIGLTDAEINTNVQKRINGSLKDTALNLITDGNIGAAKDLVTYYGDKLDANTYSDIEAKLRPALIRQDAVSTTQALFNKYGIDNEKGAYDEIMQVKGESPDLPIYLNNLKQFYGDQQKFQKQASDKYYETTFRQVLSSGNVANMQSILDNATNLLSSQRITIQNHIDKIAGRDRRIAKGTASKDDKWRSDYESNGGLDRDTETMQAYYEIIAGLKRGDIDAKEITPQGQIKYNLASIRLKKYFGPDGGTQEQQQQQQAPNPQADEYNRLFRAIKAKFPDASDDDVYAYMTHKFGGQ